MDDESLYEVEYDTIVVGTGILESIVAASLSRAGQKVLHLDTNDYYGSNFASLHLSQFEEWMHEKSSDEKPSSIDFPISSSFKCNLLHHFKDENFQPRSSSFSLDIQPKMLLANSPLVDVLVHSGVGRYLDFMAMQGTYMFSAKPQNKNPPIWEVPCSKTDVFKSKLNVLEKRHLMKFLQYVADYGEEDVTTLNERGLTSSRALKRPQNKQNEAATLPTFDEFTSFTDVLTKHFKLSTALQQVVLYAVLLQTSPPEDGLAIHTSLDAIYAFVTSIGKYAASPYLTPMYGISEVAQSFCRLSAVYSGIYLLRASLSHLETSDDSTPCSAIVTKEGKSFRGKHIILNAMYNPRTPISSRSSLRGIFVVRAPILPSTDRLVLVIPPGEIDENTSAIHVLQMDSTMGVCSAEHFIVHVTTIVDASTASTELIAHMQHIQKHILGETMPVWSSVFTIPHFESAQTNMSNLHTCVPPSSLDTTLDSCVDQAKAIFTSICPNEEFLPKSATAEQADQEAYEDEDVMLLQQAAQLLGNDNKDNENKTVAYDL